MNGRGLTGGGVPHLMFGVVMSRGEQFCLWIPWCADAQKRRVSNCDGRIKMPHTEIQASVIFFLVDVIRLFPFPVRIRSQPLNVIALAS